MFKLISGLEPLGPVKTYCPVALARTNRRGGAVAWNSLYLRIFLLTNFFVRQNLLDENYFFLEQ